MRGKACLASHGIITFAIVRAALADLPDRLFAGTRVQPPLQKYSASPPTQITFTTSAIPAR
jgi:hypothetical protein